MDQDTAAHGQMDFNLPHDVVTLPSGGLFYKSKKKSVKVGYLTASDENILVNIDSRKSINESVVLPLLRNKIYEKDLRPEELLESDIEAVLLFLRNTSFGPEYRITTIDPSNITPESLKEFQQAQQGLSSSIGRLLMVSENYPELKASNNFLELQAQLEGTENRIKVARDNFNDVVTTYNKKVRRFPASLFAGIMGFSKRAQCEAADNAQDAPTVTF